MKIIEFGHPEFLLYTLAAAIAAAVVSSIWYRRRSAILRFFGINPGRIYSRKRIFLYLIVFCLIVTGTALLFSQPYYAAKKEQDVFEPLLITIVQDISKSMLAPISSGKNKENIESMLQDLPCMPNRLQVAQQEVMNFIEVLEQQQTDKVALVVFARYAYPAIPVPTGDFLLFKRRFEKETMLENALTMAEGSNHWAGVERALQVFETDLPYRKVVIIITDGDPEAPSDILAQSKESTLNKLKQAKDISVYVVGVGEPETVLPVPFAWQNNGCPDPEGGFMKQAGDSDEKATMYTMTDPEQLQSFSNDLGGTYILANQGSDIADTLKGIAIRERVKTGVKYETVLIDLSEPLLWVLLGLLGVLVLLKTP